MRPGDIVTLNTTIKYLRRRMYRSGLEGRTDREYDGLGDRVSAFDVGVPDGTPALVIAVNWQDAMVLLPDGTLGCRYVSCFKELLAGGEGLPKGELVGA